MMVIESVTFDLVPDADEIDFLAAVEKSNRFLRTQPGFIRRELGKRSGSTGWIDIVLWESLPKALAAAERFNGSPLTAAFNAFLKKGSTNMAHYLVQATTAET